MGSPVSSRLALGGPTTKVRNGALCQNTVGIVERRSTLAGGPRDSSGYSREPFVVTGHWPGASSRAGRKGDGTTAWGKRPVPGARLEYDRCRRGNREIGRHARRGRGALRSGSQTDDEKINCTIRASAYFRHGTHHRVGCSIHATGHI